MTSVVLVMLVVAVPLCILGVILWRLLSDMPKRGQRVAGIGPFDQFVVLDDGEHVLDQALAVHPFTRREAFAGTLAFTEKRLIFATQRGSRGSWPPPSAHWITYDDVAEWHTECRRQLGIGVAVLSAVPSVVLKTKEGAERVYLPRMGYDIVAKAKHYLPNETPVANK